MSDINKVDAMIFDSNPGLVRANQSGPVDSLLEDSLLDDFVDDGQAAPRQRDLSRVPARRSEGTSGGFLANLGIRSKLGLIVLAFAIPFLALFTIYGLNQRQVLTTAAQEQRGLEYLTPLEQVLESIALHRNLSVRYAGGEESLAPDIEAAAAQVNAALSSLATTQERFGSGLQTQRNVTDLIDKWEDLRESVFTLNAAENFSEHTALITGDTFLILEQVGDRSGLGRSGELSDFILGNLTLETLPRLAESLSQLRDQGASILARRAVTLEERQVLSALIKQIKADFAAAERDIGIVTEGQPEYAETLLADLAAYESLANFTISLTDYILSPRFHGDVSSALFSEKATRAVESSFDFLNENVATLNQSLGSQIASLRFRRILNSVLVALGLVIASLLVLRVGRQITRPVDELADVAGRVSQGDLSQFARVGARDELGTLAASFNQAIVGLRQAEERNELDRQQSERLQQNVGQFLDVAMDIADGDFTKRGVVTEDVLGNVVDAINLMVDEVSGLLLEVRNAADSVAQGSGGMLSTNNAISDTTTLQTQETQKARQVTLQVTESMRTMAQNAQASVEAAGQALSASALSQEAVDGTLKGMQNIRREVQAISKRIKSLGDRSLEISEIVDTISSISSQTHLLALNASIEAAGAGAAGERFAVVAGEVRKLSEDSARATQRVATLIQDIQSEVQEVVGSVEDGTQEVEAGYRVATEAGVRLKEVAAIVQESAQFARSISDITQAQVSQVENVDSSVRSIADLSEASQAQVKQGRESAEQLKALAEQLRESLSRFRLA